MTALHARARRTVAPRRWRQREQLKLMQKKTMDTQRCTIPCPQPGVSAACELLLRLLLLSLASAVNGCWSLLLALRLPLASAVVAVAVASPFTCIKDDGNCSPSAASKRSRRDGGSVALSKLVCCCIFAARALAIARAFTPTWPTVKTAATKSAETIAHGRAVSRMRWRRRRRFCVPRSEGMWSKSRARSIVVS